MEAWGPFDDHEEEVAPQKRAGNLHHQATWEVQVLHGGNQPPGRMAIQKVEFEKKVKVLGLNKTQS